MAASDAARGGFERERRDRATEAGPLGRVDPARPGRPAPSTPPLGLATTTIVVGFAGLIAMLVVLGSIARGVRAQEVFALDTWATPFLHGSPRRHSIGSCSGLTDIGSSLVIVPIFVVAFAGLIWRRRYGAATFLALAIGGSLLLDATMKLIFERPRPELSYAPVLPDYSFPSGHTMNARHLLRRARADLLVGLRPPHRDRRADPRRRSSRSASA